MIKSFLLDDFRKFGQIQFSNLDRVNVFLGNNNAGKTTLLEAIYALTCGGNLEMLLTTAMRLKKNSPSLFEFMEMLLNMFHDRDSVPLKFMIRALTDTGNYLQSNHYFQPNRIFAELEPTLMGSFGAGDLFFKDQRATQVTQYLGDWEILSTVTDDAKVKLPFPFSSAHLKELNPSLGFTPPSLKARFVDILTHRDAEENFKIYSFLKREKRGRLMAEFVHELSETFPAITGIDCLPYPTGDFGPVSLMTQDSGLLPINSFGEGLQRWYNILGGMIVYQDAIHCMEEIDATFHPEAQKKLATNLVHYSKKYNNQLFMTSHSLEFVDNLLEAVYGSGQEPEEDCIRIITLRNDPKTNEVKSRVLTGQEAYESREKYRMELR